MTSFNELGLSATVLGAVDRMGYTQPTPVQEKAIPLVLEGRDIVAAAQTGTGKTAAFTLPSLDRLEHAKGGSGPLMLVVTPTRELATQIGDVAAQVALSTHHRITTVVGGLSYKPQIDKLKRGTDILIATPGRLIDLMEQNAVRLADVQVLVLDEADRMLDMGFLPSVKKIVAATPKTRQTLLFSATIDKSIMKIAGAMLRDPETVEIARKGDVASTVDQYIIRIPHSIKPTLLKAVLEEKGAERVIVFARTRSRADTACRKLRRAGYSVAAIHSDRSQNQRRRALAQFAAGEVNIITATDVLARGIDVDQVDYVVNYDAPEQAEDYIHRIGRTGRAGQRGFAVTFVTPETEGELRAIEKLVKTKIPEMKLDSFDLSAAEAESAQASINAQSRRDPEVNRVKRELANKAQKKAELAAEREAERDAEQGQGRRRKKKRKGAAAATERTAPQSRQAKKQSAKPKPAAAQKASAKKAGAGSAAETRRKQNVGGTQKAPSKAARQEVAAKAGGKRAGRHAAGPASKPLNKQGQKARTKSAGDFRPGRARRAEVERARSRKHR